MTLPFETLQGHSGANTKGTSLDAHQDGNLTSVISHNRNQMRQTTCLITEVNPENLVNIVYLLLQSSIINTL